MKSKKHTTKKTWMTSYRRFKSKNKVFHTLLVAVAVVFFWRGAWGLMDAYLLPENPLVSHIVSVIAAFLILYFDDFHLKELE